MYWNNLFLCLDQFSLCCGMNLLKNHLDYIISKGEIMVILKRHLKISVLGRAWTMDRDNKMTPAVQKEFLLGSFDYLYEDKMSSFVLSNIKPIFHGPGCIKPDIC